MTHQHIETTLASLRERFKDKRLNIFDLRIAGLDASTLRLEGRVLEDTNLTALRDALPGLHIDDSAVTVLRQDPPNFHFVATTLTDLHAGPSFLDEMLTQVLHGATLEVLETTGRWALVRQTDGYIGWAHLPFLSPGLAPATTHIVCVPAGLVFPEPESTRQPLTRLNLATCVRVTDQRRGFAHVQLAGPMLASGYVPLDHLRPTSNFPLPPDLARPQMVADARSLTGVYYLWGGNTAWGTDCSGLAQLVHRLAGHLLPRDASLQFPAAREVNGDPRPGDLIFFHSDDKSRITHVALSTGGPTAIHSSRTRNGIYEEDVQKADTLKNNIAGVRTFMED